jgi:putative FmdB family regulatory protein
MPIYEYACTECNHELEVLQKMNDALLKQCPACGKNTLKKLISAAAFHLKGTGWYETDFKGSKKPEKSDRSEKTSDKTSDKTSEKTSEKTPDKTKTKSPISTGGKDKS